jgi:hypothetical protein
MPDTVVVKGANRYRDIVSDYYELDSRAFWGATTKRTEAPIEVIGTGNNGAL